MNLLTKITLFIHRILGTAFSILFLVWFLSGLVMIYHTFPRADRADKRAKMDILSLENLPSLDQIEKRLPQNERISHVTLNSYLGQTVFHIRTEKGSYDIPADSTERLPVIDWNRIQRVASQWNTSSIPNKEQIERLIAAKTAEYNDLIVEMTTQQREYTVETLVSHFHNQVRCATVVELYDKLIDDMKRGGKLGNAGVYKYSRTSLLKFTGQRLQIPFSDIDAVWLRRYENWLRTSGCGDTTISQLFRTLRSVFNKAVELQLVKRDYYPFDAYKVSKFDTRTKKRAITKEDVRKVIALDLSQGYPSERLARDIFVFSYFGAGINFADIALLKYGNVRDGRVQYVRKKTGKPINFLLTEEMRNIIVKYQRQGQTWTRGLF